MTGSAEHAEHTLRVIVWAPNSETRTSAALGAQATVRDACGALFAHLAPPRTYLAHKHRPCFMQAVTIDALLSDATSSFLLVDSQGDRSMSLFTLYVIYPDA